MEWRKTHETPSIQQQDSEKAASLQKTHQFFLILSKEKKTRALWETYGEICVLQPNQHLWGVELV